MTWDVFGHPHFGTVAVKRGFSWPAFLFAWKWATTKRLWRALILFFVTLFAAGALVGVFAANHPYAAAVAPWLIIFGVNVLMGLKGNHWWRKGLERRGFIKLQTVQAAPHCFHGSFRTRRVTNL